MVEWSLKKPGCEPSFECHSINETFTLQECTRLTIAPCPIGVVATVTINWSKTTNHLQFFGGSCTAPTSAIYTLQQLGLSVTQGFGHLLQQASNRAGTKLQKHGVPATTTPPELPRDQDVVAEYKNQSETPHHR